MASNYLKDLRSLSRLISKTRMNCIISALPVMKPLYIIESFYKPSNGFLRELVAGNRKTVGYLLVCSKMWSDVIMVLCRGEHRKQEKVIGEQEQIEAKGCVSVRTNRCRINYGAVSKPIYRKDVQLNAFKTKPKLPPKKLVKLNIR